MNEKTQAQLRLIRSFGPRFEATGIGWWLFGGWGLDARLGRITRDHGDIEFWVDRRDGDAVRDVLVGAGATVLETQPEEESREFEQHGVVFSSAFFTRLADGTYRVDGRWSDWVFPAGSFDGPPGMLDGTAVPAMSIEGMLAMKEQFAGLRNGKPRRDKDIGDIALLRRLLAAES